MVYPEPWVQFPTRFESFFRSTSKLFIEDKEVIICTTHGDAIPSTAALAGIPDQLIYDVNYGSTTILKCDFESGNVWTMTGDFSVSEHLGLGNGQMIPNE